MKPRRATSVSSVGLVDMATSRETACQEALMSQDIESTLLDILAA